MFHKDVKIYVAGHRGLVGSAIWKNLQFKGYCNLIGKTHQELDLLDTAAVQAFFEQEKPEVVVLAAAHVGGIWANNHYRADFIYNNLQIQNNVIYQSFKHKVKKLLFLGSTCIYPKDSEQPIKEEYLLTSPLEYTNEPYAIAKIAGLKMCESFNLQYGTNFIAVMPTNLYGINDNFHLENSHVLPAMIRKIFLADRLGNTDWETIRLDLNVRPIEGVDGLSDESTIKNVLSKYGIRSNEVELWGTGAPLREFLWSEDMADASVHILLNVDAKETFTPQSDGNKRNSHINIGSGEEVSIMHLSELIAKEIGFKGRILWDRTKPDGTFRKLTDVTKLHALGWKHTVGIEEGIKRLFTWYKQYDIVGSTNK